MKSNAFVAVVGIIAVAALVLGVLALNEAKTARDLALSDIIIEEVNALGTPVFSEETNAYSFLAMYDISIANMSGPAVTLKAVKKMRRGAGFLTLLKGQEVVTVDVQEKAFISEKSSSAIQSNPRLLKSIGQDDMGDGVEVSLAIEPGETKVLHVGLSLMPYTINRQLLANMALVSFELEFDNGKSYIFQRAFSIYSIQ